jgi:hypothetical protein
MDALFVLGVAVFFGLSGLMVWGLDKVREE